MNFSGTNLASFNTFLLIFFRAALGSQHIERKVQRFPIYPFLSNLYSFHHQQHTTRWYIVATDESTLTHQNHPKSVVYITNYSWYCTFYRFGQMYNNLYHHYNTYRILISLLYSSSVLYPSPWKSLIFFIVTFVFSWVSYSRKHTLYNIFKLDYFTW